MLQNELNMGFNYEPITYGEIKQGIGRKLSPKTKYYKLLEIAKPCDKSMGDVLVRTGRKKSCFSDKIVWDDDVLPTLRAAENLYVAKTKSLVSEQDVIHAQAFPEDYDFSGVSVSYVCGMSVPPIMIKRVVQRLIESGVFDG